MEQYLRRFWVSISTLILTLRRKLKLLQNYPLITITIGHRKDWVGHEANSGQDD